MGKYAMDIVVSADGKTFGAALFDGCGQHEDLLKPELHDKCRDLTGETALLAAE